MTLPPSQSPATYIAVIGSGEDAGPDLDAAAAVGALVARSGAVLVCGGLGGVMAAACRGACGVGGMTLGILPGVDRSQANPWVRVCVASGLGELRNGLVVRSADAVIAIGGEYGTLSEIALALKAGRPVVALGSWELVRPDGSADTQVIRAASPAAAVELALGLASEGSEIPYG
jgi:uncharacterized protein (TIGR00725 family)